MCGDCQGGKARNLRVAGDAEDGCCPRVAAAEADFEDLGRAQEERVLCGGRGPEQGAVTVDFGQAQGDDRAGLWRWRRAQTDDIGRQAAVDELEDEARREGCVSKAADGRSSASDQRMTVRT